MRILAAALMAIIFSMAGASDAWAQRRAELNQDVRDPAAENQQGEAWNYGASYEKPTPLMIIQQKAQARAAARIHRLETMYSYGMSNARPTALATPTGMYSPGWQMPGGRPYGWYTTRRPQYILWR